jgi:hypothetical protein
MEQWQRMEKLKKLGEIPPPLLLRESRISHAISLNVTQGFVLKSTKKKLQINLKNMRQ